MSVTGMCWPRYDPRQRACFGVGLAACPQLGMAKVMNRSSNRDEA